MEKLEWKKESLPTRELLKSVVPEFSKRFEPEVDYPLMHGDLSFPKSDTAIAFESGTWDYPVIALSTPQGIVSSTGEKPDVRLVLIEGHSR